MDFFISPAYFVPPISTILFVKSVRMNVLDRTPSRSGIASNSGAAMTMNSGACVASSGGSGLMKSCFTKSACQAYSQMTWMSSR